MPQIKTPELGLRCVWVNRLRQNALHGAPSETGGEMKSPLLVFTVSESYANALGCPWRHSEQSFRQSSTVKGYASVQATTNKMSNASSSFSHALASISGRPLNSFEVTCAAAVTIGT